MTTASNWLLNWAIAYSTPYLVDAGPGNANLQSKVFFIWYVSCPPPPAVSVHLSLTWLFHRGGFCFICIFFVYTMIYETKGLSLEQVDELYAKVPNAWKSKGFVPTVCLPPCFPSHLIRTSLTCAPSPYQVSFQDVRDIGGDVRSSSLADIENAAMRKKSVGHDEVVQEKV
jgi:hypothetical protein